MSKLKEDLERERVKKITESYSCLLKNNISISSSDYNDGENIQSPYEIIDELDNEISSFERDTITDIFRLTLNYNMRKYGEECADEFIKNKREEIRECDDIDSYLENKIIKIYERKTHDDIDSVIGECIIKDEFCSGFYDRVKSYYDKRSELLTV